MSSTASIAKPRLIITPAVWDKMMFLARNKEGLECSGLGILEMQGQNFVTKQMFMVPQVNTSGDTEMDADAIGRAMYQYRDVPGFLRWHWHSHVNMSVFWSPGDQEMIAKNCSQGWFVHTVINVRGDKKSCVGQQKPFPFFIDDIETVIENLAYPAEVYEAWQEEYTTNVRRKTYEQYSGSTVSGLSDERPGTQERRSLPSSRPYGDSLDRHADPSPNTQRNNGRLPVEEDAQGNLLNAGEMNHSEIIVHLERRISRLERTEAEITDEITNAPHDTDLHSKYLKCLEDIEEAKDLIGRMRERIDEAAADAVEASMTSPDAKDAASTPVSMTEGAAV